MLGACAFRGLLGRSAKVGRPFYARIPLNRKMSLFKTQLRSQLFERSIKVGVGLGQASAELSSIELCSRLVLGFGGLLPGFGGFHFRTHDSYFLSTPGTPATSNRISGSLST